MLLYGLEQSPYGSGSNNRSACCCRHESHQEYDMTPTADCAYRASSLEYSSTFYDSYSLLLFCVAPSIFSKLQPFILDSRRLLARLSMRLRPGSSGSLLSSWRHSRSWMPTCVSYDTAAAVRCIRTAGLTRYQVYWPKLPLLAHAHLSENIRNF